MSTAPARKLFTIDEYYQMAEAGILPWNGRDELIEGDVIQMSAVGSAHASYVDRLTRLLTDRIGHRAIIRVQNPVRLSDLSEPQPDLAVLKNRPDFYAKSHPRPADVLLLIEVADTSLPFDREVKIPAYALSGIPEVWIVNVPDSRIEVYRQPSPEGYRQERQHRGGETVRLEAFPDAEIPVESVLA